MNVQLSLQILGLCNQFACAHSEKPEDTVKRAMLYRYFMEGEVLTNDGVTPVAVTNPIEPGTRRKRRTKAEMEAAKADLSYEQEPGVKIEDIQKLMLQLFDQENGIEVAQEVLSTYGVKQVKDLKPEDYGECLSDLQDALSDVA